MKEGTCAGVAVADVVACIVLGFWGVGGASMAGLNANVIVFYVALLVSLFGSFYLLANRRALTPVQRKRGSTIAVAFLAASIAVPVAITFGGQMAR